MQRVPLGQGCYMHHQTAHQGQASGATAGSLADAPHQSACGAVCLPLLGSVSAEDLRQLFFSSRIGSTYCAIYWWLPAQGRFCGRGSQYRPLSEALFLGPVLSSFSRQYLRSQAPVLMLYLVCLAASRGWGTITRGPSLLHLAPWSASQ